MVNIELENSCVVGECHADTKETDPVYTIYYHIWCTTQFVIQCGRRAAVYLSRQLKAAIFLY